MDNQRHRIRKVLYGSSGVSAFKEASGIPKTAAYHGKVENNVAQPNPDDDYDDEHPAQNQTTISPTCSYCYYCPQCKPHFQRLVNNQPVLRCDHGLWPLSTAPNDAQHSTVCRGPVAVSPQDQGQYYPPPQQSYQQSPPPQQMSMQGSPPPMSASPQSSLYGYTGGGSQQGLYGSPQSPTSGVYNYQQPPSTPRYGYTYPPPQQQGPGVPTQQGQYGNYQVSSPPQSYGSPTQQSPYGDSYSPPPAPSYGDPGQQSPYGNPQSLPQDPQSERAQTWYFGQRY